MPTEPAKILCTVAKSRRVPVQEDGNAEDAIGGKTCELPQDRKRRLGNWMWLKLAPLEKKIKIGKVRSLPCPHKKYGAVGTPVRLHPLIPPPSFGRQSLETMARKDDDQKVTVVEQGVYPVPDIPIKDLLDSIPYVVPFSSFLTFLTFCIVLVPIASSGRR